MREQLTPSFFSKKSSSATSEVAEMKLMLSQFLNHVVKGNQDKVKELLEKNSQLVSEKENITDVANRTFTNITGFQYALWAQNIRMCQMLLGYLSKEEATSQLLELEQKGTSQGKYFNLTPLIQELKEYAKKYDTRREKQAWKEFQEHWSNIGKLQLLLPAHIMDEYYNPKSESYPGTTTMGDEKTLTSSEELICGIARGVLLQQAVRIECDPFDLVPPDMAEEDADGLENLRKKYELQFNKLRDTLMKPPLPDAMFKIG